MRILYWDRKVSGLMNKIPVLINLCDEISYGAADASSVRRIAENLNTYAPVPMEIRGVRIGAETCGFLFAGMQLSRFREVIETVRKEPWGENAEIHLVIPVAEQSAWGKVKELIRAVMREPWIDSVTVNDLGALKAVSDLKAEYGAEKIGIVLGRYLDKRARDPRNEDRAESAEGSALCTPGWLRIMDKYGVAGTETECLDQRIAVIPDPKIKSYVHLPYALLSTGQICEYSGINMPEKGHFRIGRCSRQCCGMKGYAFHKDLKKPLIKSKNALYIKNRVGAELIEQIRSEGSTIIYTDL